MCDDNMMQKKSEQHIEFHQEQNNDLLNMPGMTPELYKALMTEDNLQMAKKLSQDKESKQYEYLSTAGPQKTTSLTDKEATKNIRLYGKDYEMMDNELKLFADRAGQKGADPTTNELYLAMVDMNYVANNFMKNGSGIDEEKALNAILRMYTASDSHVISHSGKISIFKAARRNEAAEEYLKRSKAFLRKFTAESESLIQASGKISFDASKGLEFYKKFVANAAKAVKNFYKSKGDSTATKSPEQIIKEKLEVYRVYDREIRIFRYFYTDRSLWPRDTKEFIENYESLMRAELVIKYRDGLRVRKEEERKKNEQIEKNKQKEKPLTYEETIKKHIEEEDDKRKITSLNPNEVDMGLSEAQLKGIKDIDEWLIRNAQNGGVLGMLPLFHFKNDHGNFVNVLLGKTKRERLYIYYLVESDHRKEPSYLDVPMSQNGYIPSLDAFKDKVLATKFKVLSRLFGEYTYMHKLSEASQINEKTKDQIKLMSDLENNRYEESKVDNLPPLEQIKQKRINAYAKLYAHMVVYRNVLIKGENAEGDKKKTAEEEAKAQAAKMEEFIKEFNAEDAGLRAEAEEYFEKDEKKVNHDVANRAHNKVKDLKNSEDDYNKVFGKVNKIPPLFEGKDASSGWLNANMWTGTFSSSLAGLTSAMSIVASVITLAKNNKNMDIDTIVGHSLNIGKGAIDIAKAGSQIVDIVKSGGKLGEEFVSKTTKILSYGSAGLDMIMATHDFLSAGKRKIAYDSAKTYFESKHEKSNVSQKEKKYEENMLKLSKDLINRKNTAGFYHAIGGTATMISVTIPGITSTISAAVGGVTALVGCIRDGMKMNEIRTAMFDAYFSIGELVKKILLLKKQNCLDKKKYIQGDPEVLKASVRNAVSSQACNCDMKAASDYIANEYSEYVYNKLFGPQPVKGLEREAFIRTVVALGCKYNEIEKTPSISALCTAMKGE